MIQDSLNDVRASTARLAAHPALRNFVDGLQKEAFPLLPAIQATWLWLLPRRDFHPIECATLHWARLNVEA
jgi:hypothetical protein